MNAVCKLRKMSLSIGPALLLMALVLFSLSSVNVARANGTDLIITGVIDGPLTGGIPKAVEFYVLNDIADLSDYGFGSANNGGGTDGEEFTFPADSATAGDFIYVATESTGFNSFFGFDPNYTDGTAPNINGDDAIELFYLGSVVDVFGDINQDGTGQPWEYLDGWAYRVDGTGPDGTTFTLANWIFSGPDALDGETTNDTAATPFPTATHSPLSFSIAKTAPDMVAPDEVFTYTIVVANFTGISTTGTVITDVVPSNADFASASDGGVLVGGTVRWAIIGDFADGDVVTRTFQVTATSSSGVDIVNDNYGVRATNWLTMVAGSPVTTTVSPLDLIVTKTGPDYAVIGENVVYTITLNNTGVATATNVVLTDTLPMTTTYVADSSGVMPTNPSAGVYVWSLGDVSSGTIRTFNLTVTVNSMPGPGGTLTLALPLTNKIEASTDTAGDNLDNNTDTWTLTACPLMLIHDIQGDGFSSPLDGRCVFIEGVVVGDFQDTSTQLRGFFVQEEEADVDADPLTSEGIFVYDYGFGVDVSVGDVVRVRGEVDEYYDLTRLSYIGSVEIYASGATITPTAVTLPLTDEGDYEPYEGMLLVFPQDLTVTEVYFLGRYGQAILSQGGRLFQPTNVVTPGVAANNLQAANDLRRLLLDDGSNLQNPDPIIYPSPELSATNTLRIGDTATALTGVLDYAYGDYRLQPTTTPAFVHANPRPSAPASVGGTLHVASFNVLNYFSTIDTGLDICGPAGDMECRGADSASEFTRQRAKIINAIVTMDADVVGLMEMENNATAAIQDLISGLNAVAGAGTYDYVDTGTIGTDAIKVAFIYQPGTVTPVGSPAILDSSVDPLFNDELNRPALAQAFQQNATGARFTAVVNHLKSKSSDCDAVGDPDTGDGQGNCNLTRTSAATALVNWLATDPTGCGDPDFLIIGDLNSYAQEDPIVAIKDAGYTNLVDTFVGMDAYSYVYGGQSGYLDHALSNADLTPQVVSATVWHINTDEPGVLDYNEEYKSSGQVISLYDDGPYRASDHDPVIVGLDLIDQTALAITKSVMPTEDVSPGDTVTYTITIANTGDADAAGVVITDELPPGITFGGYVSNPGGTAQLPGPTGVITWEYPVASGASYNFVFTATVTAGTLYYDVTNVASFTSDNGGSGSDAATFTTLGLRLIYLPLVARNY